MVNLYMSYGRLATLSQVLCRRGPVSNWYFLVGACTNVYSDLGLYVGFKGFSSLHHHLEPVSKDLATIWKEKGNSKSQKMFS